MNKRWQVEIRAVAYFYFGGVYEKENFNLCFNNYYGSKFIKFRISIKTPKTIIQLIINYKK